MVSDCFNWWLLGEEEWLGPLTHGLSARVLTCLVLPCHSGWPGKLYVTKLALNSQTSACFYFLGTGIKGTSYCDHLIMSFKEQKFQIFIKSSSFSVDFEYIWSCSEIFVEIKELIRSEHRAECIGHLKHECATNFK